MRRLGTEVEVGVVSQRDEDQADSGHDNDPGERGEIEGVLHAV